MKDLVLAIDIGTGSARAALVEKSGRIIEIIQQEHDQITPKTGWSEQKPSSWWQGAQTCVKQLLTLHKEKVSNIAVVSVCGQMHGTVLLDKNGELADDRAILWNDKRPESLVEDFTNQFDVAALVSVVNNPPTTAWPAFKLSWVQHNQPDVWSRVHTVLMPKDFINFKLTGNVATDYSEASCFYLMDQASRQYDADMLKRFNIPASILPPIFLATDVIGQVSEQASQDTLIPQGVPVIAGTSDMAATLLGSGVYRSGQASDSTGTSTLITVVSEKPTADLLLNNLHLANPAWGTFSILDAGGDAMRWARLALQENNIGYADLVAKAKASPVGSNSLLFLPYLTGERNSETNNSRAQFFGLSRKHRLGDMFRSVMEGVAFAAKKNLDSMVKQIGNVEQMIASGGGAKDEFWLQIKASAYNVPIVKTDVEENGVLGCAMLGGVGVGLFDSVEQAAKRVVTFDKEILPIPEWVDHYQAMFEVYDDLYTSSQRFYNRLDQLDSLAEKLNKDVQHG